MLLPVIGACSLDRRRLHEATGGKSSSALGSAPAAGDSDVGGFASAGDSGFTAGGLVDGCADLDTDGVADCSVTLLENAEFAENVEGWEPQADAELTWDGMNALEDSRSGSAMLTAEADRASAEQCVKLQGRKLVIVYANAFVEDETELGQAELQVSFFENEGCDGEPTAYFETPASTSTNRWVTVQAGAISPAGMASLSVALVRLRKEAPEQIRVYFDNVMLKSKELM
jgi:hypothetical protein